MADSLILRAANKQDTALILQFIEELADYEKMRHEVVATQDQLQENLFGDQPQAEVIIAEWGGAPVGFALFFHNFSTFAGRRGLYLEDLYVRSEFRGKGIGKTLLIHLAVLAKQRDCARFEWAVLDWNQPARDFYENLGAQCVEDWRIYRAAGERLDQLSKK
ncbi:MAG TPA: GNAT family N-acetyltransferase [Gammaproteobacteria bacterium]|nr:GNAT family N-acetyltransferase [Gammaproteobacteria bacterium]